MRLLLILSLMFSIASVSATEGVGAERERDDAKAVVLLDDISADNDWGFLGHQTTFTVPLNFRDAPSASRSISPASRTYRPQSSRGPPLLVA